MPSSVGLWASSWAEGLLDGMALAMTAYDLADRCPLGSAAAYGVPLPIDRQLTSDLLGFARPFDNVLHAAQTRGQLEAQVLFALGQIMLVLSRAAEDLILLSMPEFGYFRLPVTHQQTKQLLARITGRAEYRNSDLFHIVLRFNVVVVVIVP